MKTDILSVTLGDESGKPTQGSIRFDSLWQGVKANTPQVNQASQRLISFVDASLALEVNLSLAPWQSRKVLRCKKQNGATV
jgi:hypothetical protein